jgi:peptide-methionine (S)-S-oxide reductase
MKIITYFMLLVANLLLSPSIFASPEKLATAIFAGGCFWSMQHDFEKIPGVVKTTVGYTGGTVSNPTYQQVSSGTTGHYEAIQIIYDPNKISYQQLLASYWHDTDPTDARGQFCDKGSEYRPVIFYLNSNQKNMAEQSKTQLIKTQQFTNVMTQILPAQSFYPAEEYHQNYADKNPVAYQAYRLGCRRDNTLEQVWKH